MKKPLKKNEQNAKKSTIKVIGGMFKGHSLLMPHSHTTRSSKSILKESLFNTLQNDILSFSFVEIFAGTGSIGIEALSRGAKSVIFFEKDPEAFAILRKNIEQIQQKAQKMKKEISVECNLGDSFFLLPQFLKQNTSNPLILFFDPPFPIRENCAEIYEKCFDILKNIDQSGEKLVIFEHLSTYKMPQTLKDFCIIKTKKFGKSALSYYSNLERKDHG
ncbi:DNA methylase [Helicobacter mustelae]|uniref:16S rRNA (guanine(966)-N(2))-methyltransferase RsmD n=1 Tax=Helicobacter mustelae TaxID=217 RepID=UPI000E04B84F|nr:16S rRNA (guanine(966)-N(2))-methyltransferase RsmD [Helicobacter mustelae]STP12996.1 DNA methylase [Helicobacter mustelae]